MTTPSAGSAPDDADDVSARVAGDGLPETVTRDRLARLAASVPTETDRPAIEVEAPFSGNNIGTIPASTSEDVRAAVERARAAQRPWADRDVSDRAEALVRFHDLVLERRTELLDLVQLESGKARIDAFEE